MADRELDSIDYSWSFFQGFDKLLKQKYLGEFSEQKFGEPKAWHGVRMHTFYELTYVDDQQLYLTGDLKRSNQDVVYFTAKLIPSELKYQAEKCCAKWRAKNSLWAETVEEVVLSIFGDKRYPPKMEGGFALTNVGLDSALENLIAGIPEINP
jgi:hypothetical protein